MERKLVMQLLDEIKHALINKDIVLAEDILEKYPELINYKTRSEERCYMMPQNIKV